MEYTFDDWLKGKPEPKHPFWPFDPKIGQISHSYKEIVKAKKKTFDWSLEVILELGKKDFLKKIEGLNQRRKEALASKMIIDSKKKYEEYEINDLIFQSHPNKFDGIDGKKYLAVKKSYEDFIAGINLGFAYLMNNFFDAVLFFELNEFYQEFLENGLKEPNNTTIKDKGESLAVKYKLIVHFFNENEEYNNLKIKDRDKLLGFILGCHHDTAKHIKNNAIHKNPDGKYITYESINRAEELIEKIKKGKL
jgi:hypothetical protein